MCSEAGIFGAMVSRLIYRRNPQVVFFSFLFFCYYLLSSTELYVNFAGLSTTMTGSNCGVGCSHS